MIETVGRLGRVRSGSSHLSLSRIGRPPLRKGTEDKRPSASMTTMIVLLLLLPLRRCRSLAAAATAAVPTLPLLSASCCYITLRCIIRHHLHLLSLPFGRYDDSLHVILLVGTTEAQQRFRHTIKLTYYERIVFDSNVTINPSIKER